MDLSVQSKFLVKRVSVAVSVEDGRVHRRCRMTLVADLDQITARALGEDAEIAREGIVAGGVLKTTLSIDTVVAECRLEDERKRCFIPKIEGVKAEVSRGRDAEDDEDGTPADEPAEAERTAKISLTFEFPFADEAWLFLGRTTGAWADVEFAPLQQRLPGLGQTAKLDPDPERDEAEMG